MNDPFAAFRAPELLRTIADSLAGYDGRPLAFMEVCGTHTVALLRSGIKDALPAQIRLLSGPGCPVCVTDSSYIDLAIELANRPEVIIATFGDLLRVPGSRESLLQRRAAGADVRIVYSPLDALALCTAHPDRQVVFLAVGFETTIPVIALAVLKAQEMGLRNFTLLTATKTMPRVLEALADDPDVRIDGFILPGHVATITGTAFFADFCRRTGIPGAVAGFEPADLISAIAALVAQHRAGVARLDNLYARLVRPDGNQAALAAIDRVFTLCDTAWRGIGVIPASGLRLREALADFDAMHRFHLEAPPAQEPAGCRCGEVLKGKALPSDCPLFGRRCLPTTPVGACMVSAEGACAAYYQYGRS